MTRSANVCVIIAAYNSQATIVRAIRSALMQPEVCEVVVVDDASADDTIETAVQADDGSGRLQILGRPANRGPAASRNFGIARSASPFIAVLDADDFYLQGRFAALDLTDGDWDALADNIVFTREASVSKARSLAPLRDGPIIDLSLEGFVRGNLTRPGQARGELGFLKPVIRRSFLEGHRLRYDERLRLGEDFDLYAHMLARGAKMGMTRDCYYVAVERRDSLSVNHRASDLRALLGSVGRLKREATGADRDALQKLHAQVAARCHHREFLSDRRENGMASALWHVLLSPRRLRDASVGVARDKFMHPARPAPPGPRLLLSQDDTAPLT